MADVIDEPSVTGTAPAGSALPVTAVTLFASGVAHIVREGAVEAGEATVTLNVRTAQVNDLLKSLTLIDPEGEARAVTYPSRDPVERTLQSFAVDVTQNLSRADLLRQVRGAEATVQTIAGETLAGRIVGAETRSEFIEARVTTTETLILLSEDGLTAIPLDKIRLLRLLDGRLDREFREALTLLASSSDEERRQITLRFSGEKSRRVRVAYIVEAPLWKVTYRLALEDGGKPYLQGWAIVENVTDEDWNGVELALISGRPVSFVQDLYQPLYIHRPVVPPDVIASPFPQTHEGDLQLDAAEEESAAVYSLSAMPVSAAGAAPQRAMMRARSAAPMQASEMKKSVSAQASGASAGELFEYRIAAPLTLPRQQAAMIPIVAGDWGGQKLSLYNATSDPRFPLNAVRLKNESELHLKGGPVTIFDAGTYAGDARMTNIPPGDERLLTYAVDLAVEGEQQETASSGKVIYSIKAGVLVLKRSQRRKTVYTFKSKAKMARTVLVEHPFLEEWKLIEPEKADERTPDRYRFVLSLAPGERKAFTVTVERPVEETVALLTGNMNALWGYVTGGGTISPSVQDALRGAVERRRKIQQSEMQAEALEQERETIHREQERIRGNLATLDKDSALYRRYVGELDKQETRLAELRAEGDALRGKLVGLKDELQAYTDALEID